MMFLFGVVHGITDMVFIFHMCNCYY